MTDRIYLVTVPDNYTLLILLMRNVFLFIRRYFNFLSFLVLQILALTFLFQYNKFHNAAFMNVAGEITGKINEKYNNVEYYFKLNKTNEALARENVHLRTLLKQNYESPDTTNGVIVDSIRVDSLLRFQKYRYYDARVVGSFVSSQNNYLTIHRGAKQGIRKDMGVIGPSGIVGRVVNVSDNFAIIMSALHKDLKFKAKLKKSGENGTILWDGVNPLYILLTGIPKSAAVAKGDSIVTSELSSTYPPDIMVGTVIGIVSDPSSNFFSIKLKTATNFFNVQYVYVVEALQKEEISKLEEGIK
ncbi:MAG: rod shape-determining protein MreC [Chitinophagaceae bacterium]